MFSLVDASACSGRDDGNYEFKDKDNGQVIRKFFTQCSNGNAYCQPCWPEDLEFSQKCNQCLYNKDGKMILNSLQKKCIFNEYVLLSIALMNMYSNESFSITF